MTAIRPPTYDAPETTGLIDGLSGTFFSSDCFGALLQGPAQSAAEVPAAELREGLVTWATLDAPWLHTTDRQQFAGLLGEFRGRNFTRILSSHLPSAEGMTGRLCELLQEACDAPLFFGPDQAAMEAMMASAVND